MNKNYTLKELAEIGAGAAYLAVEGTKMSLCKDSEGQPAREAFTKAILDAIGYEFPKDEELEAFERWSRTHHIHDMEHSDAVFAAWKAGREELRRSQMMAKEPGETKTEPAWIPWAGGECPVSMNCRRLEVRFRDGEEYLTDGAYRLIWTHSGARGDIVAYRVWEG